MDDQLLHALGRSLHALERDAPALDSMLMPRQVPSGENAGKAPAKKGSKLPLVVDILDVKQSVDATLSQWISMLLEHLPPGDVPPARRTIMSRAAWLQSRLLLIDAMPWGEMCAERIVAVGRQISNIVDPPTDEHDPIEVGPVKEIASWCRHLGVPVSTRTVYRWVQSGEVESWCAPDARLLVRLADVLERARTERANSKSLG